MAEPIRTFEDVLGGTGASSIDEYLASIAGEQQLINNIKVLLDKGYILDEDTALKYYNKYRLNAISNESKMAIQKALVARIPQEMLDDLSQFTTPKDLQDKIDLIDTDLNTKADIYDYMIEQQTPGEIAMRSARGRALTEQEKEAEQLQLGREKRGVELTSALNQTLNNPYITQAELNRVREGGQLGESYLKGESPDFMALLADVNQKANQRAASEEQAGRAYLQGINRPPTQTPTAPWQRPGMPSAVPGAEGYLQSTGYAPGSQLRSFIESQIPDIYSNLQAEREAWWNRMNPQPQPEPKSYEDEADRIRSEMGMWEGIAGTAPSSKVTGGTYWGEGGLASIARGAADYARQNLANLRPGGFETPSPVKPVQQEEDPFLKKLRSRNWMAEYQRQPGTGASSRYVPGVKFA